LASAASIPTAEEQVHCEPVLVLRTIDVLLVGCDKYRLDGSGCPSSGLLNLSTTMFERPRGQPGGNLALLMFHIDLELKRVAGVHVL
jgi:hypothetical protein